MYSSIQLLTRSAPMLNQCTAGGNVTTQFANEAVVERVERLNNGG